MFKAPHLRNYLLFTFLLAVAVPLGLLSAFHAYSFSTREEREEVTRLQESAQGIANSLESLLTYHRRGLDGVASEMTRLGKADPELLTDILQESGKRLDQFVSMIAIDDQGRVIAQTLVEDRGKPMTLPLGRSVADREYFKEVVKTKQPFTSSVFMGRSYAPEPIVAMSAPVFLANGKMLVVEGSVNLFHLHHLIDRYKTIEEGRFAIVDASGHLVYASEALGFQPLQDMRNTSLLKAGNPESFMINDQDMESWASSSEVKGWGWRVFVIQPTSVLREHSLQYYGVTVLLASGAIILAMLLARFIAGTITKPIEQMVHSLATFTKSGESVRVTLTPSTPVEIVALSRDFDDMTGRLGRVLGEMLPICASCKKIRDDKAGDWKSMESYITHHTDTQLTHGVCPDCMERLYPEFSTEKGKAQRG